MGLKVYYTTITHLKNRQVKTIYEALKQVYVFYYQCGYRIVGFRLDREFDALLPIIGQMAGSPQANLTSANEHVPEIERRIRVVKERCRATRHGLPYSRMPVLLLVNMVLACGQMLNNFPSKGGVSSAYSPCTILTGKLLDYKKDLALEFGAYCQVHEEDGLKMDKPLAPRPPFAWGLQATDREATSF